MSIGKIYLKSYKFTIKLTNLNINYTYSYLKIKIRIYKIVKFKNIVNELTLFYL